MILLAQKRTVKVTLALKVTKGDDVKVKELLKKANWSVNYVGDGTVDFPGVAKVDVEEV